MATPSMVDPNHSSGERAGSRTIALSARAFRCAKWVAVLLIVVGVGFSFHSVADAAGVMLTSEMPAVVGNIDFEVRVMYRHSINLISQVLSNRVHVDVMSHWSVELVGDGDRAVVPGGIVSFVYKVTNAGNVVDAVALAARISDGEEFTASWWYDIDENGRLSPADIPVSDFDGDGVPDTGPLSPGMSRRLLLVVGVPEEAPFAVHAVEVVAVSVGDPEATATWLNYLEVSNAAPYLSLNGAPETVYVGKEFVLPIHYGNDTGTHSVTDAVITLELSPGVDFIAADPPAVYDSERHELVWEIGEIPAGSEGAVYVMLRAHEGLRGGTMLVHRGRLVYSGNLVLESTGRTRAVTAYPSQIQIVIEPAVIRADGKSSARITAGVVDVIGNPVADGTMITIEAELGSIDASDNALPCEGAALPGAACARVPTRSGIASVDLIAPRIDANEPVTIKVRVSAWTPDTGLVTEAIWMYFSPGAIVGRLIDLSTNLPEVGVEVRLIRLDESGSPIGEPMVRYTDENGYYIFPVPEGRYVIVVVRDGELIELPQIEVEEAFDSITFAPIVIRGHLIDRETGLTISGSIVDLLNEKNRLLATTVTDEEGAYLFIITPEHLRSLGVGEEFFSLSTEELLGSFNLIQRPQWWIRARTAEGRGAEFLIDDVRPGDMYVNLVLWVEPLGRVYDLETGQPIASAEVTLAWAGPPIAGNRVMLPMRQGIPQTNPTYTDEHGTYVFYVEPGYYFLEVRAEGYREHRTEPMVVNDNRVAVAIGLTPTTSNLIELKKVPLTTLPRPGDTLGYVVEVINRSGDALSGITVIDWLPGDVEYVPGSASAGGQFDPGEHALVWQLAELEADRSKLLHYEVVVGEVTSGSVLTNLARGFVAGESAFATAVSEVVVAHWPVLAVTKEADQQEASIGDVVRYRIVVENQSETAPAFEAQLLDRLPHGFMYNEGSTVIDGVPGEDPVAGDGGLVWTFGDLLPGERRELQYAAVITLEASGGDGVNRASVLGTAEGGFLFQTPPAIARTRVNDELFGDAGRILGRVYVDLNGNGRPDPGEPGLEGVEVVLDDGRRAFSGAHGFFSIPDVAPGVRSLKLVAASLPHGVGPSESDGERPPQYDGATPVRGGWSQFATVFPGGTVLVDFGVSPGDELPVGDDQEAVGNGPVAGNPWITPGAHELLTNIFHDQEDGSTPAGGLPRIVAPEDASISYRHGISVTVEGAWGKPLELLVNGEPVPESAVGRRVEDPGAGILELTFYGVTLQDGVNRLAVVSEDARHEIAVVVAGRPRSVELVEVPASVPYRAERRVPITLEVTDALGLPVEDGTVLTVAAEGARVWNRDLNPTQPGVQMATAGGRLYVDLGVAGDAKGPIRVRVTSGDEEWVIPVETRFDPEPALLVGTLNVRVVLDGSGTKAWGSLYYRQGWEGDRRIALRYHGGGSNVAQGPLASLLAAHPVDSSRVEDLAPSSAPYYLRYEWDSGYVLYGDYSPQENASNRFTLRAGRVTGWDAAWTAEWGQLAAYHFPLWHAIHHAVLPGQGISGLYHLPHTGLWPGSEEVKLVAYHADDAERRMPLESVTLRRGVDYEIDYDSGTLLFRDPVPSVDREFRRVFIEVTYTVEDDTTAAGAFGLQYRLPEFAGLSLAVSYTGQYGTTSSRPTYGIDGRLRLSENGVNVEYALGLQPASVSAASGQAHALQLSWHPGGRLSLQLGIHHVTGVFVQPGYDAALNEGSVITGTFTRELSNGGHIQYEHRSERGAGGEKHADRLELAAPLTETLAGRVSLSSSGPEANPWSESRPLRLGLGLDWAPSDAVSLAWQQEVALQAGSGGPEPVTFIYRQRLTPVLTASLRFQRGAAQGGTWIFSLESSPAGGAEWYGRYRRLSAAGTDQVVLGVRNRWEILPGLTAGIRLESTVDVGGGTTTAGSWHLEYTAGPLLQLSWQQEFRLAGGERQGTWRLGAEGDNGILRYRLGWMWVRGGSPAADGRSLLQEFVASVLYRDPVTHRVFVVGELVQRTYTYGPVGGFGSKTTRETLAVAEAGLRLTPHWTLAAKAGLKQNVTVPGIPGAGEMRFHVRLQQLSVEYAWDGYTVYAFVRSVRDAAGHARDGFAVEVVRFLGGDVGVGVGYSSLRLDDPDLQRLMDWPEGSYLRLVWKF